MTAEKDLPCETARSPGVKHRHYAPKADVVLVEGGLSAVTARIRELVEFYGRVGKRVGVLCTDETVECYSADVVRSVGSRS